MAELWTARSAFGMRFAMVLLAAMIAPIFFGGVLATNFEAAFQGECREDSPCQHICFDLHDGTFECSCKDGFTLGLNGYSCIVKETEYGKSPEDGIITDVLKESVKETEYGKSPEDGIITDVLKESENSRIAESKDWNETTSWPENGTAVENIFDSELEEHVDTFHTEQRQIPKALDQLKAHADSNNVQVEFGIHNDIQGRNVKKPITYGHKHDKLVPGRSLNSLYDKIVSETTTKVVPAADGSQPMNTVFVSTPPVHQRFASCADLQCESGGICVPDMTLKDSVRCRCPLGRRGSFCEQAFDARYPRFREGSYLVLPVLRDAHKSMQVTMEFRPEANEGLLIYSGEKFDLQEDFISVTLNKGFIEFRFDCGMGEGILISDQPVLLHSWNTLTIYRDRWDAWMQLNSGSQVQGRSKGLFSRITFRLNLFVGGSPNISLVSERTSMNTSFRGCLRHLAINRQVYDFRSAKKGDTLEGVDIDECSADVCSKVTCYNGGQCVATSPDHGVCLCPLGFIGNHCETAMEIIVPLFNGSSYLQYPGMGNTVLSFIELQLVFKPYRPNGVLFYNGFKMDGTGDFISINLVNGFVEFRFDLGTGVVVIRSHEPVGMGVWHTVFISRTGRYGILEVDQQPKVEGISPGAFTQLSLPLNMYIGGIHDFRDVSKKSGITDAFTGCIQKVVMNGKPLNLLADALSGVNVANCLHSCVEKPCENGGHCEPRLDYYTCHCHLGYAGNNCENEVTEMIAEPMFTGASYLHYVDENIVKRIRGNKIDIQLRFRSFGPSGLLLWAGKKEMSTSTDFLSLGLKEGYLHFQYNLGSGEVLIIYNHTKVDDGKWHFIRATRIEQEGSLVVDNGVTSIGASPGPMNQLNINNGLYLGGMENIASLSLNKYHSGLVGCLANVTLSTDYHIRLITHATTGINIQPCL